ncbi:MAG: glycosyltransferase family 4 protein [Candidatus Adlerbacteria bacterium]
MNIAYVANIRFPTEKAHGVQIAKACEALVKNGKEVTLIVPSRRTDITEPAPRYYGITTPFAIKKLFTIDLVSAGKIGFWIQSLTFASSVLRYLRSCRADAVYGRDELVLSILYMGGVRNIFWESHDGAWNIASRYIAKHAKGVVCVSQGLKDFYKEKGVPIEKILAVPNGIALADFAHPESKEIARVRLGIPVDKKIALYVGRLDGWKGTDTLFDASHVLPSDWKVAVVGGEEKQIAQLQKKYPYVLFLGYRPYSELPRNQAAADVLVVPNTAKVDVSVHFTSPLKLIAHMASHRPIVASDLPSIRELVDESSAVLVVPDNSQALAEGIQRALQNPTVAEHAFARVSTLDWQVRAQAILRFIENRVGAHATAGR